MTELVAAGGCYNAMRYARDGAGAGARDWVAPHNTAATMNQEELLILAVNVDGDDMNAATDATFKLQWENFTDDAGTWIDLAGTGELIWSSSTDLVDGNAVVSAEDSGGNAVNCSTKGWSRADGIEKEGANGFTRTISDDEYQDFNWAIDLSGADHANSDVYGFRLVQSDDTVIGTSTDRLTVVTAGKITGTTKNRGRVAAEVSVSLQAYLSDGGTPPMPTGAAVATTVSDGSTGVYTLNGSVVSGLIYHVYGFKDAASDLSGGSVLLTAVDR